MHKIPTLFVRDYTDPFKPVLTDQVSPGCEWVLAGEGVATRKYDGVSVMFDGTDWWARRMVKSGKDAPAGFQAIVTDATTGHTFGWEPIEQSSYVKMWREAVAAIRELGSLLAGQDNTPVVLPAGTFELVGPKINGNPEGARTHRLEPHANAERLVLATFDCDCEPEDCEHPGTTIVNPDPWDLVLFADACGYEGVVWHHPDGRRAKLKVRDLAQRVVHDAV